MKRLIVLVVLAVVLGSGGWAVAQAPPRRRRTARRLRPAATSNALSTCPARSPRPGGGPGFGTSGTVAKVSVSAGQRVRPGQVLARLDTTALDANVTEAEATLARAKAQLASDEDAQAEAVDGLGDDPAEEPGTAEAPDVHAVGSDHAVEARPGAPAGTRAAGRPTAGREGGPVGGHPGDHGRQGGPGSAVGQVHGGPGRS